MEDIYKTTKKFPKEELHGLISQMQRCAVSIPSNIAEGYARVSKPDQHHFYRIAFASSRELETQLEIARRLKYASDSAINENQQLLLEVMKMLSKMVFTRS